MAADFQYVVVGSQSMLCSYGDLQGISQTVDSVVFGRPIMMIRCCNGQLCDVYCICILRKCSTLHNCAKAGNTKKQTYVMT